MKGKYRRLLASAAIAAAVATGGGAAGLAATASAQARRADASSGCRLPQTSGRGIKHVIYVIWDNTHFLRDNPNVPSDLEQMPHLLNFLRGGGALLTNEHTPLIAHTADDVVTSETGLYPDQQGLAVANSYGYFRPDGSVGFQSAFTYWIDRVQSAAQPYNLITQNGKNAPAPWVPYTRAGCNFGAIASGDIALENTSTAPGGDIYTIFGPGSPLYNEAKNQNSSGAPSGLAEANFEGLAIHCAQRSSVCADGEADKLPDEPFGYTGFKGLFGALQVDPALGAGPNKTVNGYLRASPLTDLFGRSITDGNGNAGFPGFDGMQPANSLAIVAAMQEHGVPVTYDYLTDAHDNQLSGTAFGPGEAGYVAQLKAYDAAFAQFFARLARDGINQRNTLFVFTADEGDHFVGAKPTNPGCNGVVVPCTYTSGSIGEIDADLAPLLSAQTGNNTVFSVHNDSAPVFYIKGNPGAGDPVTRELERDAAMLDAFDPIINTTVPLTNYLAGRTELKLLHMQTGDPARTPSFVMFANPNYYLDVSTPASDCPPTAHQPGCIYQYPGDAYNHGDVAPEINRTWLGLVGPGVKDVGETGRIWSDHTDDRPTMMALLGLHDDYAPEGVVLTGALAPSAVSPALRSPLARQLARLYTQLEAPVGEFGLETLKASTGALRAGDYSEATYSQCDSALSELGSERDYVGGVIHAVLLGAQAGTPVNRAQGKGLVAWAQSLLARAVSTEEFCTT